MFDWEKQMHEKYSDIYNYYYNNNGQTTSGYNGPSFSSQLQCNEWASYVEGRHNGTIKCPCCGK